MNAAIPVASDAFWVGANDRETDLFEGIWPLPRGVSYNAYLLVGDRPALVDTVKKSSVDVLLRKIRRLLGSGGKLDYLVINHMEPDHSGCVAVLREIFPAMRIVGNKKTAEFVSHLYGITDGVHVWVETER